METFPVVVRVRASDPQLTARLVRRDAFLLSGIASDSRPGAMRAELQVDADGSRSRIELAPCMTPVQTAAALARALPERFAVRARRLSDGLEVTIVHAR